MQTFYYDQRELRKLTILNAIFLAISVYLGHCYPQYLGFISFISVLCLVSFSASLYVWLFPQKLAVIDATGIKIDHNTLLKWEEIAVAEKFCVSHIMRRDIIRFTVKDGIILPLTFMQKISKTSPYGAFSIPLYAMTTSDRDEIEKHIRRYIAIKTIN